MLSCVRMRHGYLPWLLHCVECPTHPTGELLQATSAGDQDRNPRRRCRTRAASSRPSSSGIRTSVNSRAISGCSSRRREAAATIQFQFLDAPAPAAERSQGCRPQRVPGCTPGFGRGRAGPWGTRRRQQHAAGVVREQRQRIAPGQHIGAGDSRTSSAASRKAEGQAHGSPSGESLHCSSFIPAWRNTAVFIDRCGR